MAGVPLGCASNDPDPCGPVKGDFCRAISTIDGSQRKNADMCAPSVSPWTTGSCKHGKKTANQTCTGVSDPRCNSDLPGDFCAEGLPAKMCADSGLWCKDNSDCPGSSATDVCAPATSRMMTVKRALRRAITDYSDKVNFGFMNTYQGRGIPVTAPDATTAIFPYVEVPCSGLTEVTETKFLTRGELEKAGCFSLATGPRDCTIDYGGNGAINGTPSLNRIDYSLVGTNDSRWAIPRTDGSGKYNHADPTLGANTSWLACASLPAPNLPTCDFGSQGTGLYEGSYYTFKYYQGTIPTGHVSGAGSLVSPVYFETYKGKFIDSSAGGGKCYNAVDAERTDIVNDGIYGRVAYTGHPYDSDNEVQVPWGGSSNSSACDSGTGAIWNQKVVPFLNSTATGTATVTDTGTGTVIDTSIFGSTTINRLQKTLMTTARLERASFGGVDATGKLAPIGCALADAGSYMSTVQGNDSTNNGGTTDSPKPPCWSNSIVLVVDGQSNGPGDTDAVGTINCASTACASPTLTDGSNVCNCSAITHAKALADSGVQTYVVVNAPATWSARYPYTYAFLWNLALAGSKGLTTASFGTTEDEVYKAVSDKIAAAAYHFTFTTTVPVAGANMQDPVSQAITTSNMLYSTSVGYPSWKANLWAFDTTSSVDLKWDALKTFSQGRPSADPEGHPGDWTKRRIFFQLKNSKVVHPVLINSTGAIVNASELSDAGLGASSDEAQLIMQWLLGKPTLGNPAPLMGSITSSTPIVVGQGGDIQNPVPGSATYAQKTWKRPQLVYVGADDGMLHAFFAHVGDLALGEAHYYGGEEAFAFIPQDMLPVITRLYAQGGQKLAVDKSEHIFGLAASPKVKDMCIGSTCDSNDTTEWHTVLVMPEGPGGNKPFVLDITNVVDATALHGLSTDSLLWSAPVTTYSSTYHKYLGETTSVPAFYYDPSSDLANRNRLIFASGYPIYSQSGHAEQGLSIMNVVSDSGKVMETKDVMSLGDTTCPTLGTRAVLADVTVARNYASIATSQTLMAAYVVDTYGNTFQYLPATSSLTNLYSMKPACKHPLYFAPAVVQLDRSPKSGKSAAGFIYLVQVTNSNLDPNTIAFSDSHPASQLVVTKLDGNNGPPTIVRAYNPLDTIGQIVLTTDPNADPTTQICLQPVNGFTGNAKLKGQTCADAGGTLMPETTRPVGTPIAVLRSDGLGFQVITSWFDPSAAANDCSGGKQYNYGTSYVTVHEFGADGSYYQIAGLTLTDTVLTGVAFIGTGLFVDGINAASTPSAINIGETFSTMQQAQNNNSPERYARTSWSERVDM